MTKFCEVIVNGKKFYVVVSEKDYARKAIIRGIIKYLKNKNDFIANLNVEVRPIKETEYKKSKGY
jgi:hypothetical protein